MKEHDLKYKEDNLKYLKVANYKGFLDELDKLLRERSAVWVAKGVPPDRAIVMVCTALIEACSDGINALPKSYQQPMAMGFVEQLAQAHFSQVLIGSIPNSSKQTMEFDA